MYAILVSIALLGQQDFGDRIADMGRERRRLDTERTLMREHHNLHEQLAKSESTKRWFETATIAAAILIGLLAAGLIVRTGTAVTNWLSCPKCRGEVGVPDDVTGRIHCPKCDELVFYADPQTKVKWRAPPPSGEWMKPAGYASVTLGVLAFFATAYVNWGPRDDDQIGAIVAGLLNPLFFIGFPLGIYWLRRCGEAERIRNAFSPPKVSSSVKKSSSAPLPPLTPTSHVSPRSDHAAALPPVFKRIVEPPPVQSPCVPEPPHTPSPLDTQRDDS